MTDMIESGGCQYGSLVVEDNKIKMTSVADKSLFEFKLDKVAQCVLPQNNKNDVEIQFHEIDTGDHLDDNMVQITFHLPPSASKKVENEDDEDGEDNEEIEESSAEVFQKQILDTGLIRSLTGSVIVEFSKEQGTFATPRGRYGMQMTATYMRMQGAQYDFKIMYSDINSLFLLPRPDGQRMAFVIALSKPIRQGNQKYSYLVLETNKLEEELTVNLTEEEIQSKYDGQLSPFMRMPLCNLIAKVFKVLSQNTVFIPKHFISERKAHCVKCSLKASDGSLYPLAKSFIFIHKPTVLIKFEDVNYVEFQRYRPELNSATKNFDLLIAVKSSAVGADGNKEYSFVGIERAEFANLHEFLLSKKMEIRGVEDHKAGFQINYDEGSDDDRGSRKREGKKKEAMAVESDDEDSEEDEDYTGAASGSDKSGSDSDSSGSDSSDDETPQSTSLSAASPKKKQKVTLGEKSKPRPGESLLKRKSDSKDDSSLSPQKKKNSVNTALMSSSKDKKEVETVKPKKDKNAPKQAKNSYLFFVELTRAQLKADNPTATFGELTKLAGESWKALDADAKVKYEILAKQDKERYKSEMSEYVQPEPVEGDGKKKGKKEKDPNAPKAAISAYIHFGLVQRPLIKAEHAEWTGVDVLKEIATRWKALTPETKAPFEEKATADKKRFDEEMITYKAGGKVASSQASMQAAAAASQASSSSSAMDVESADAIEEIED